MDPQLQKLLDELASPHVNTASDAQYELEKSYGANALPQVLNILGTLNVFSRRCAIEYIQRCDVNEVKKLADKVLEVLLPMVHNDDEVTRSWSAQTLGWLGLQEAIPAIQKAQMNAKAAGVPLDFSEQEEYRWALSQLGARRVVLPERARQLINPNDTWKYSWEIRDCDQVIREIAGANQVILYLQFWKCSLEGNKRRYYWSGGSGCELDWTKSWSDLVVDSQANALASIKSILQEALVVTISWIDESDR